MTKSLLEEALLGQRRVIEGKSGQHISKEAETPHPDCPESCGDAALTCIRKQSLHMQGVQRGAAM